MPLLGGKKPQCQVVIGQSSALCTTSSSYIYLKVTASTHERDLLPQSPIQMTGERFKKGISQLKLMAEVLLLLIYFRFCIKPPSSLPSSLSLCYTTKFNNRSNSSWDKMVTIKHLMSSMTFASAVSGCSFVRRSVIPYNLVDGFRDLVPPNVAGSLYLKYQPSLKVYNGCVPFPAVDECGNIGSGVADGPSVEGDCSKNTGQVYVRAQPHNGFFAIMYSWYMPLSWTPLGDGHAHDWENMIVWLSDISDNATVVGMAVSQDDRYEARFRPDRPFDVPRVGYNRDQGMDVDGLIFTEDIGDEQPMAAWETLPDDVRQALTEADFGEESVPFIDLNFEDNLRLADEAW
ncbi:hypothetical protein FZEAL_3412 [Fusarium zealandicum]|uniref:Necrosis inducing protein n=1 Tax=Fusarium zealandicum TaxID=1053134 RepID=A0A8H4UPM9_9HYPO|nr:hypothetical protein FZEAL_3412 [Fusarium zealandicum]